MNPDETPPDETQVPDQASVPDEPFASAVRETPVVEETDWLRLDKRKLLLDPLSAIRASIIPIIAVIFGASSMDSLWWVLAAPLMVAVIAVFGLIPWFTTTYRISPTQFQLRKGVLNRTTSTAPLDRIRSVDLEATLLHRLLGMRKVQVGTGVDSDRIELNAVTTARAEELRSLLLTARAASVLATPDSASVADGPDPTGASDLGTSPDPATATPFSGSATPEPERVLATLDWSWVRFAPFNFARLAVVAAAIGLFFQFFDDINIDPDEVADSAQTILQIGVVVLTALLVVGAVVAWLLISVIGYVVQWWGLRLTRAGGSLNLTSGLLTTRSISVEEKRVRGIELVEPLLMRFVNGAELSTLATGVGAGGTTTILPHCPTSVATRVAGDVLGDSLPLQLSLTQHGFGARRRRHVAFQWMTLFLLVAGLVGHAVVLPWFEGDGPLWWFVLPGLVWLPLGVVLAELSYAHLGHAMTRDHFIVGHGTTARKRTVLEVDGIIGWVMEQNFFQRRLGLVTLRATTAAGAEQVTLIDVPEKIAVRLTHAATPEPVRPFLTVGEAAAMAPRHGQ